MHAVTRIDLLRHGEVAGGARLRGRRCDDPLSAHGRAQLERMAGEEDGHDLIVSSSLVRCRDFATALAARRGCELVIDDRLAEYDFGDWDGRTLADLWAGQGEALATFLAAPDAVTPPGGESAEAFRRRVRQGWRDLLARTDCAWVLVIGHGGVLRQVVADILGAGPGAHAALEWPHAAMTRIHVQRDPGASAPGQSIAFHARVADPGRG